MSEPQRVKLYCPHCGHCCGIVRIGDVVTCPKCGKPVTALMQEPAKR